jgi:carboxymethylenebutenolidase
MTDKTPTITQPMIDLYDEYTHLTLDRRRFMDSLTKLAGSAGAAAVIAPMLGANAAKAQMVTPADPRLKASDVTYPGAGGDMKGYLVTPANASGKLPAVIVIHENRGLNAHIRDVTRRVALEGFVALAPDYLSPNGGTPTDEEAARNMFQTLDAARVVGNSVATVAFLKAHQATTGKVGAMGFCWGGGAVNDLAVASPDLAAGVVFYGRSPKPEDAAKIKARMLLHFASLDERINATVPAYEAALKAANVAYTLHMYEGVNHAFHNDTSEARYNKAAAELAFSRTIAFFKASLA